MSPPPRSIHAAKFELWIIFRDIRGYGHTKVERANIKKAQFYATLIGYEIFDDGCCLCAIAVDLNACLPIK